MLGRERRSNFAKPSSGGLRHAASPPKVIDAASKIISDHGERIFLNRFRPDIATQAVGGTSRSGFSNTIGLKIALAVSDSTVAPAQLFLVTVLCRSNFASAA